MKTTRITTGFIILTAMWLLSGCTPGTVFQQSEALPAEGWPMEQAVGFEVEVTDTLHLHELYLEVRNTTSYGYSNLYLFMDIAFPGNHLLRDTIECRLAERSGRWTGKGFGRIKTNEFLFRDDVWFPDSGTYSFSIRQGMREETLEGITDIGIRIKRK
jgi:gliding motility-associated lipoprotein GldH